MKLEGYCYESGSAARRMATFNVEGIAFNLMVGDESIQSGELSELSFSERIGNTPRKVVFKDGSVFETQDNNKIDEVAFVGGNKHSISRRIQMLESKWRWALTSVVFLVVLGYFITTVMLPWAGRELAFIVPSKVNETISSGGIRLLDQKWFEPSELSDDKKNEIRESFTDLINTLPNSEFNYKLYFRNIGEANAFSLPAGEIILTDELVRLAENPEQITAILLHEIGHVHHRHVMQQVIRSSLISVAISMATSDLSALEDLVVVLPVFVLESGYSQADEIEADAYMFEHMVRLQMNPIHFANVIQIITQDKSNIDGTTLKYFASHPETSKRIENAIRKSKEFLGDGDVF
jgi:Zn-dependent protease with chaperone function